MKESILTSPGFTVANGGISGLGNGYEQFCSRWVTGDILPTVMDTLEADIKSLERIRKP
jgi:hypothetical protein